MNWLLSKTPKRKIKTTSAAIVIYEIILFGELIKRQPGWNSSAKSLTNKMVDDIRPKYIAMGEIKGWPKSVKILPIATKASLIVFALKKIHAKLTSKKTKIILGIFTYHLEDSIFPNTFTRTASII